MVTSEASSFVEGHVKWDGCRHGMRGRTWAEHVHQRIWFTGNIGVFPTDDNCLGTQPLCLSCLGDKLATPTLHESNPGFQTFRDVWINATKRGASEIRQSGDGSGRFI